MPEAGDGFTVVSAMRHTNPNAITLVFTGYPASQEAAEAILLQADEVLLKPMAMPALITVIREQLVKRAARKPTHIERVDSILERDVAATIQNWLERVDVESELTRVHLATPTYTRARREGCPTHGLLSPNKGIERVIEALPRIVTDQSEVLYVIVGATHPHIRQREGDKYRLKLQSLAKSPRSGAKCHL